MMTHTIRSWRELAQIAEDFATRNWIFRGVEIESYQLVPKIGRPDTRKLLANGADAGYSLEAEKRSIERFRREVRPHLTLEPRSLLEWLSLAQHHGLPTRLLDWTTSPVIAAYFAVRPPGIVRDASLFALPPPFVVENDEDLDRCNDEVVAYFPQHLTRRITNQRGLFTWHRFPDRAYQPHEPIKWVIPSAVCLNIKLALNKSGINEATLFPDVDGIARHVEWLHKWDLSITKQRAEARRVAIYTVAMPAAPAGNAVRGGGTWRAGAHAVVGERERGRSCRFSSDTGGMPA